MEAADIKTALVRLRDELSGHAGIRATIDPATLQPPGVWVTAAEIPTDGWTLTGPATLTCWLYLVAGNVGVPEALDRLSALLVRVLEVVTPDGAVNTSTAVSLPNNPTPLPAFLVPVALDL